MVINTLIACQQLHAFAASSVTSLDSTANGSPEKRGKGGSITGDQRNEGEEPCTATTIKTSSSPASALESPSGHVPDSNAGSSAGMASPHVTFSLSEESQTVGSTGYAGGGTVGMSSTALLPKSALRQDTVASGGKEAAFGDDNFGKEERLTSLDKTPGRTASHQVGEGSICTAGV